MRLPDLVAYQAAVQHPPTAFTDADLRGAQVTTNRLGLPRVAAGNFALTYQLCSGSRQWAVRCFHRDVSDRARRYAAISHTLAGLKDSALVRIEYLPVGVRVGQQWYPVTKMRWLEGRPLNRAIEARLGNSAGLAQLEQRFISLTTRLHQLGLAHGDLQHGNILVEVSGDLKLVDYDGMYVPALKGLPASESGDPNYQHPGRKAQFSAELDRFSELVIFIALRVLAQAPELWRTYNTDDNLLFRRTDFAAPDASPLFRDLRSRAATRDLAERFARVCQADFAHVPRLADFLGAGPSRSPLVATPSRSARVGSPSRYALIGSRPRSPIVASPVAGGGAPAARSALAASFSVGGAAPAAPSLRPLDIVALNRIFAPRRVTRHPPRRSWSVRRAVSQEALAFSPDGSLLATAESNGKVRVREARTGRVAQVWSTDAPITEMACSPDGGRLVASGPDGTLRTLSLRGSAAEQQVQTPRGDVRALAFGSTGPIVAAAHGSSVDVIAVGANRQLRLSGFRSDVQLRLSGFRGAAAALALSADGHLLAAGSADGSVRCWSLPPGELVAANRGRRSRLTAIAVAANGRMLASAGSDGVVSLWAIPGGHELMELHCTEPVSQLAFSADALCLAATTSSSLVVWQLANGAIEHTFALTGAGTASGLAFSPDGAYLAVTTRSGGVSMRALPNKKAVAPNRRPGATSAPPKGRPQSISAPPKGRPQSISAPPGHPRAWFIDILRKLSAAAVRAP